MATKEVPLELPASIYEQWGGHAESGLDLTVSR